MIIKLNVKMDNEDGEKIIVPFPIDSELEPFQLTLEDPTIQKCVRVAKEKFKCNVDNVIVTTVMQVE
jgi:hypothetical protein